MKRFVLTTITLFLFIISVVSFAYGKTVEEISKEISAKQAELAKINEQITKINAELAANKATQGGYNSEISKVRNSILILESELNLLALQSKQIQDSISLKELEKAELEKIQDNEMIDNYVDWKVNNGRVADYQELLKNAVYSKAYYENTAGKILGLATDIDKLNEDRQSFETQMNELNQQIGLKQTEKLALEKAVSEYNNAVALANASLKTMRNQTTKIQRDITIMTAEQARIIEEDNARTNGGSGGSTQEIIAGDFYFSGTGRDAKQGHGVGMSQWGAFGAAEKGWSASKILTFYYTNTKIESRPTKTLSVQGYGNMDIEDYVSGIGEVADRACGTAEQITNWDKFANEQGWAADDPKRKKYVLDNPNTLWDCWPEEAIKAQVIAARSYVATYSGTICTTASCQVYDGTKDKAWAAYETKGMYVISNGSTHNNQIIRALYSADNSQGYGTADNDTVFSGNEGNGTAYSYLRHVNDVGIARTSTYTNWAWRTNGYSISKVDEMITFEVSNNGSSSTRTFIGSVKNTVGTVQALEIIKDGSNRVKKVKIIGSKGSAYMSGWMFKSIWNDWVNKTKVESQRDYIYSLTFSFTKKT